jgi:dTDP-4-dehydrorhamnose reductase
MDKKNHFDTWNIQKKELHLVDKVIGYSLFEIVFMKIGSNIGYEQDGKGEEFLRPVLVYKKFNNRVFLGIPLTSVENNDKFHFEFEYKKGKKSYAILSQIRLFDIKRAKYKDGKISKKSFKALQDKLLNLIVTPLENEGERTKAICTSIIPENYHDVNILVTGANGQLGSELKELSAAYPYNFFFTDRETLDITNEEAIKHFVTEHNISAIINCAAYTAVDKAQSDEEGANTINHLAVKYLASIAKEKNIKFIHISTDYVFDGTNHKPYSEDDAASPQSVYGATKLAGEQAMISINPANSIIIRTSWVYSTFGANFVKTMIRLGRERDSLGVIFDQVGTPTYARDLARMILDILPKIQNHNVEIYHYSNEGVASWYDFAKEIMQVAKIDCHVNPIETKEYPTPAQRPHFSLLNKSKIKNDFGIMVPYWKESLKVCLLSLLKD